MTQQVIQVGTTPNDGQGTPLRNSFIICNENFSELYARAQVSPPPTLHGSLGDEAGWYAYDSSFFYYCFQNYTDGVAEIWAQISQVANVVVTNINDGTSNVRIDGVNGNAITSVAGTPNVVIVTTTGQFVRGVVSATGNITGANISGSYFIGDGSQLLNLPPTYTDSNVSTLLANFGSNTITTTGNVTTGNIATGNAATGNLVVTGNIAATANISTPSQISATGNITTAGYFVGTFIGNVVATLTNIPGPGGAVVYNDGSGNAAATAGLVYTHTGPNVLTVQGSYSATGNVIANGFVSAGSTVSAVGNITGGNLLTAGAVSAAGGINSATVVQAQGNIRGGNLISSGLITASGTITGSSLLTGGAISAAGNIAGNYLQTLADINAGGNVSATNYTGTGVSITGNVTAGNVKISGIISAAGNITGAYYIGNGSQLTGVSNYANSNATTLLAAFGSNSISTTGNITAGQLVTANTVINANVSTTGNVIGNYYIGNGSQLTGVVAIGIGTISSLSVTGNITTGNLLTGGIISSTGNITGGNLSVGTGTITVTNIVNGSANATGNIGTAGGYFNTVFAKATSAQYADLAENYTADGDYAAGTVVIFGGEAEITISTEVADERVAGAISTEPAHLMNAEQPGLPVALRGRVPVQVTGPVTKGDSLVTSSVPGYAQSVGRSRLYGQAVFAKALETNLEDGEKTIIAVIL
jgi:hypothetical protein